MIQELFGGGAAGLLNRDRNLPVSGVFEASPSPSPSSSTTNAAANAATNNTPTTSDNQKLRCPRCDSSNTKFCYYNNYNLTQPRHFCKTCRRYWTKGGALRNVPIGGGCRKNKGTTISAAVGKPISSTGKLKAVVSSELGRSGFINGFEHEFTPNPILWSGPPQTSHLLSLLRATQNPNPNPNPNFASNSINHMKDQNFMVGSNISNLGFEPLGQNSSLGLCSSLWRNHNQMNHQQQGIMSTGTTHHDQGQNNTENNGQRYQRLRSSSPANYYNHHQHDHNQSTPLILGNTSSSTILDSAPVLASGGGGGELGFSWNQNLQWSDLPTANGAYP